MRKNTPNNHQKIIFKSLKYNKILVDGFDSLERNNIISFTKGRNKPSISVIYAPNGTGKTTLANLLGMDETDKNKSFSLVDESGVTISPEDKKFHVIYDQLERNIISGNENDFLVASEIQREYELKTELDDFMSDAITRFKSTVKDNFGIKTKSAFDRLVEYPDQRQGQNSTTNDAASIVSDIISQASNKKRIQYSQIFDTMSKLNAIKNYRDEKAQKEYCAFICEDLAQNDSKSAIALLFSSKLDSPCQHMDSLDAENLGIAVKILNDHQSSDKPCIVCDSSIKDLEKLKLSKTKRQKDSFQRLTDDGKDILNVILNNSTLTANDPFEIKNTAREAIRTNNKAIIDELKEKILKEIMGIVHSIIGEFINCFNDAEIRKKYQEYSELIQREPDLDDDGMNLLKEIIDGSLGRALEITRDNNSRSILIKLDSHGVINTDRKNLKLSTGEQNFISLAFEVLRAKKQRKPYVVIDDPISSMDSIYANKITFFFSKFLQKEKKTIILTHNINTIRLLYCQDRNSLNLYIMKNEGTECGFLEVNAKEVGMINNLGQLINLLSNMQKLNGVIKDKAAFLMAISPFMRAYAEITNRKNLVDDISSVVHGSSNDQGKDIAKIYEELFPGTNAIFSSITIDADKIISEAGTVTDKEIIDASKYPLLNIALTNTLRIMSLRIRIERILSKIIQKDSKDPVRTLGEVIDRAFPKNNTSSKTNVDNSKNRAFFFGRLTTINQFIHYEQTLNPYQSAIDVNEVALKREIGTTIKKLEELEESATSANPTQTS